MSPEYNKDRLASIEADIYIQGLIGQANARYILYNTREEKSNFPNYDLEDIKLNTLAFYYLNLGCRLLESKDVIESSYPLEKGAAILEYIHGSPEENTETGKYYGLISAMAYYASFQYSKSFILINKTVSDSVISKLIALFLKRDYYSLLTKISGILTDENYSDAALAKSEDHIDASKKVYEVIISKALNNYVNYLFSGEIELLNSAKEQLEALKEIAELKSEPDIWWVIRLLILISEGFREASIWEVLGKYFDVSNKLVKSYIHSLAFLSKGGVYELFITQRNALPKALDAGSRGCVVSIPTSSGKTRIAEIAILNCINNDEGAKVLFITPYRSLAYEVESSLEEIFENTGILVSHLYGGSLFSKLDERILEESNVIVATPEKAKAMFRGNNEILDKIKLAIIDEGHLLGANQRLIVNEMFYEELRYAINKNNGRFLLLSAVLPNSDDLAQWLTTSTDTVFKEKWRPSDERIGILEWTGNVVNLDWISADIKIKAPNTNFITKSELPLTGKQRKPKSFPSNKNQAVAATAYKLRVFGPALIFAGRKDSVFVLAREYLIFIGASEPDFIWKNPETWKAFELSCIENYGNNSEWLVYARKGILCHNADLHTDVRLPLERLMRSERPLVIIATSTLGQGVNLGISSVIFSSLRQAQDYITPREFWNIAGRAGRAFVDHEGKILVALDTSANSTFGERQKVLRERSRIMAYFDKTKIDDSTSGLLILIAALKRFANANDVSFDLLLQLVAENKVDDITGSASNVDNNLDWIDDSLLSLHSTHNENGTNDDAWVEKFFTNSLAHIQSLRRTDISGDEIISFIKSRVKGIIAKVGSNISSWESAIKSGIPLNSDIQINSKLQDIIDSINTTKAELGSIEYNILLVSSLENILKDINVFSHVPPLNSDRDIIRALWLSGATMSAIMAYDNSSFLISNYYSYNLPWVLNGISKKLFALGSVDEAEIIEDLSILVEFGLPSISAVKVYQAGIRSRVSATEIGSLIIEGALPKSMLTFKRRLIMNAEALKKKVSPVAGEWLELLVKHSKRDLKLLKAIPNFVLEDAHNFTGRLYAKMLNGIQYLVSPDFSYKLEITGVIDFSVANDVNGVYFDYDRTEEVWKLVNNNPNVSFVK